MRIVRIIAPLFLLLAPCRLIAQDVPLIFAFEGNTRLSDAALEDALRGRGLSVYRPRVENSIREALSAIYAEHGFTLLLIDSIRLQASPDSSRWNACITLDEGPAVLLGDVVLKGDTSLPRSELLSAFDVQAGSPFSDAAIGTAIARMLALLDRRGYPFASAAVADVTLRADGRDAIADVVIEIEDGGLRNIDEFTVEGNSSTKPYVIVRETRIAAGERFDSDKVNKARKRIERLGFFSSVSEPVLYLRDSTAGLLLRVAEGNTNLFDGVIGYQPPRVATETGYLTGLVNLSFRNLFGTGRRFDARWERATRTVTELELRYLEPWLLGFPLNLSGGFFQRQEDSAYVRRALDGKATWLASGDWSVSATAQSTSVIPDGDAPNAGILASGTLSGGLELLVDTRNDAYFPTSGIVLRNAYQGGNKSFTRPGETTRSKTFIQRLEIDLSWFQGLFKGHAAAVSAHGRELRGSELDASDLYRLGGANTLRGYREEQFLGARLAWLNFEYRLAFARRSFAFAFFDIGYVSSPDVAGSTLEAINTTRNGYGIGARLETGLGIIGVSYALGKGDGFANGKIHFGLVNEF